MVYTKQKSCSVDSTLTTPKKNETSCDSQKEGSKEQTESTPVQPLLMETSATPSMVNSSNVLCILERMTALQEHQQKNELEFKLESEKREAERRDEEKRREAQRIEEEK